MIKGNLVPQETVEKKIILVRGHKVMLDKDLAMLYDVATGNLNKAVNRNIERFPKDFMFRLNNKEFKNLKFHFGTSSWGGTRKAPYVFTEHGILMLSSVLKSKRAVQVNIQIMRTFTKLRQMLASHKVLFRKMEVMEKKYNTQFKIVFEAIRELMVVSEKPKKRIGFHNE